MEEEVVDVEVVFEVAGVEAAVVEDLEVDVAEEASEEEAAVVDVDSEVANDPTVMVWCDCLISVFCYTSKTLHHMPVFGLLDSEYGHCLDL